MGKEKSRPFFEQLFERYSRPVSSFFARRGFSRDDCLELTQETFLGVYRGMERFRRGTNAKGWVFTIATNIWRNEVRRRKAGKREGREVSLDKLLDDGQEMGNRPEADPLAAALRKERHDLLHDTLQELPEQMRQCLLLRIDQQLKYHEIATVMQVSVNTVKSQLFQAKQRLQKRLAEEEAGVGAQTALGA